MTTLGVIIGTRGFFPADLCETGRKEILSVLEAEGIKPILLPLNATPRYGAIESLADAQKCADLFKAHGEEIAGILVTLPNFGDERAVANALRWAGLNVPVLIHAFNDDGKKMTIRHRRDSFCGKMSVCNNLRQYGISYTLTRQHTMDPASKEFRADLRQFAATCNVVKKLKNVRLGALGARPAAFNTVRYSEKLLERYGISVTTVDLSELLAKAGERDAKSIAVKAKLAEIKEYAPAPGVPAEKLLQMARMGAVLTEWMEANELDATALQCWTSVQQNLGCNVCTLMSMMSEKLMPSACEVDVTGVLTMYAMQLAAGSPAAIVDWNNNYGEDENKCVLFHCGNWAKSFLPGVKISNAPILGSTLGVENTYGALDGRTPGNPLTYGRVTTADAEGRIRAYLGEGELTDDPLDTFGSRAVAHIPRLQGLMEHVCRNGFEHHVVMTCSHSAAILNEAFGNYFGWESYWHRA